MTDTGIRRPDGSVVTHEEIDAALQQGTRDALLEHARMGRPVCEWRDGQVVWIPPEEIFARYGLDANGKPLPA